VIAKGLLVNCAACVDQGQLLKNIQNKIPKVTKLKIKQPQAPMARFTIAVLYLCSTEAATRLCERSLV
jgi:hypothetical protein